MDTTTQEGHTAYTWRRTPDQVIAMDDLTLKLKRVTGRSRLDTAEVLAALTDLAAADTAVFAALASQLRG